MGRNARKSVFRVSDKVRFKQACSATETSNKVEISFIGSLYMILSDERITQALIRLPGSTGCLADSAPLLFANP